MMEDFEIDFDFTEDPISRFLQHKLEEIRSHNMELEQQLNRRKQIADEYLVSMASKISENLLEITETWTRSINDKWIIGVSVKTTKNNRTLTDIEPVLKWNCSTPLVYTTTIFTRHQIQNTKHTIFKQKRTAKFAQALENKNVTQQPLENEWILSDKIHDNGSVIVYFDVPQFIENKEYEISGILTYKYGNEQYQLPLLNFSITAENLTNKLYEIKSSQLTLGDEHAYLSLIAVHEKHSLIVKMLPSGYRSLENQLEFECGFTKINIHSRDKVFYVDNVTTTVNGSIVQVGTDEENDTLFPMTIFCRNQNSFLSLLHYLYQHIPGIIILSSKCKNQLEDVSTTENYSSQLPPMEHVPTIKKELEEFWNSLEAQINTIESFCTQRLDELPDEAIQSDIVDLDVHIKDYKNFRTGLAKLELESDKLYTELEIYASDLADVSMV